MIDGRAPRSAEYFLRSACLIAPGSGRSLYFRFVHGALNNLAVRNRREAARQPRALLCRSGVAKAICEAAVRWALSVWIMGLVNSHPPCGAAAGGVGGEERSVIALSRRLGLGGGHFRVFPQPSGEPGQ